MGLVSLPSGPVGPQTQEAVRQRGGPAWTDCLSCSGAYSPDRRGSMTEVSRPSDLRSAPLLLTGQSDRWRLGGRSSFQLRAFS